MENSMTPAEMANSANYAAMNYGELLNTKTAYSWAIGFQIEPRLKTRRREEMVKITQAYVTAMNGYDATREEILSCLETVGMKETHMFSSVHDVDDQTSSVREEARQDNGKSPLALPEPVSIMGNQDMNAEQESLDSDTPKKDEAVEDDFAASSPEGDSYLVVSENKDDVETPEGLDSSNGVTEAPATNEQQSGDTKSMASGEQDYVGEALEALKALPTPDTIDANAPYYVEGTFEYGDSAKPGYSYPMWRNMGMKDLESFRSATEKYEKLFLKHDVLASTDDYLVVNQSKTSLRVRMYHFPEDGRGGEEMITSTGDSGHDLSDDELKHRKKWYSLMRKAIKQAKELSLSDGTDANTPFYDRYKFSWDGKNLYVRGDRERFYEEADTLSELMPSFETYARLYHEQSLVVSKDNCVANKFYGTIYLVLFNIPSQKKMRGPKKKSGPTAKDSSVLEEHPLITKAVEMTKNLPVNKTTDKNSPYFLQCDFSVTGNGDLFPGRTFSRNVDSIDKFRTIHQKCASKFKSTQYSFTEDYTAYMWSGDKTISVFYYIAKDKAEALA